MIKDTILMIPYLSKELNLLGHSVLPYEFKEEKSDIWKQRNNCNFKIEFDSNKMVQALIHICFELVKQVKTLSVVNEDNILDKLNFEKISMEKKLRLLNAEVTKQKNELAIEKESKCMLLEKITALERQVKYLETENKNYVKKSLTNVKELKAQLKKRETEVLQFHKLLAKQFHLIDKTFIPENFEIMKVEQPDFVKLWSDVKYSNTKNKIEVLKMAVCQFQENNDILMQDNLILKNLLFKTLQELHEIINIMIFKKHLKQSTMIETQINDIFKNNGKFDVTLYKSFISKNFSLLKKLSKLLEESSFSVFDEIFVCLSDVIKKLKL